MFDKFASTYKLDRHLPRSAHTSFKPSESQTDDEQELFRRFGGSSFNDGIYRVHRLHDAPRWNSLIEEAFPEFTGRISTFGYDWLGRQFALDLRRSVDGQPGVLMFEPGTGEVLEIPANLSSFHDTELVEHGDAALASMFFSRWLENGGGALLLSQCCGYIKPLFLGGDDDLENLEVTEMTVYWGVAAQLLEKIRKLPPGTPVGSILIR